MNQVSGATQSYTYTFLTGFLASIKSAETCTSNIYLTPGSQVTLVETAPFSVTAQLFVTGAFTFSTGSMIMQTVA
jgi:hypothetical protein